mmetsp:Transcript_1717/g.3847  ORF Transcript_1717/g.3847 Transcript_1717/m.3847 type:complete len:217 (-) Transcript_1717:20-670(-)
MRERNQPSSRPSVSSRTSKRAFPVGSMKRREKSLSSMLKGRISLDAEQKASSLTGALARWSVSRMTIQFWGKASIAARIRRTASGTSCSSRGSSPHEQQTHRLDGKGHLLVSSPCRSAGLTAYLLRSIGGSFRLASAAGLSLGALAGEKGFHPPNRPETLWPSSVMPPCFPVARALKSPSTLWSLVVPSSAVCAPLEAASKLGRDVPPHIMVVKSE